MKEPGINYQFSAKVCHHSSSPEMPGWMLVLLPKKLSFEIRKLFKELEEGWGRMKVTAQIGKSEWRTAIWFDTKQGTYLLPIKAEIRKKEQIVKDQVVNIVIMINI